MRYMALCFALAVAVLLGACGEKAPAESLTSSGQSGDDLAKKVLINPKAKALVLTQCSACHAEGARKIGPPWEEILPAYQGKEDQFIAWMKKPEKKRKDYPMMMPVALDDKQLRMIARYLLAQPYAKAKAAPAK